MSFPIHVAAICLLASACSTHHTPRPGPRLSVVMSGGSIGYHRDGQTYSQGFLGAGLIDAVEDVPEARQAAETFHERQLGGFIAVIGGTLCGIAGAALLVDNSDFEDDQKSAFAAGALACWIGATIAGSVLVLTAQPYQWDAINIYNDHVDRQLELRRCSPYHCPPGWVSPYAPYAPHGPPAPPSTK